MEKWEDTRNDSHLTLLPFLMAGITFTFWSFFDSAQEQTCQSYHNVSRAFRNHVRIGQKYRCLGNFLGSS